MNDGYADAVIFLSGDQHWAEFMAKRMPSSPIFGESQVRKAIQSDQSKMAVMYYYSVQCTLL